MKIAFVLSFLSLYRSYRLKFFTKILIPINASKMIYSWVEKFFVVSKIQRYNDMNDNKINLKIPARDKYNRMSRICRIAGKIYSAFDKKAKIFALSCTSCLSCFFHLNGYVEPNDVNLRVYRPLQGSNLFSSFTPR